MNQRPRFVLVTTRTSGTKANATTAITTPKARTGDVAAETKSTLAA